ncbi:hypothetical protein [Marinobacterium jannaschii]|uniref:hypothetical protein n=1 Tax=Marinobacterium jannaschii TaxID=64970 RepID=UPI0004852012|nr:hypothetical protein [Marinobacterium jannaschii]
MSIDRESICDILLEAYPTANRSYIDGAIEGALDHVVRIFSASALQQISTQRWAIILCTAAKPKGQSHCDFYTQVLDMVYEELTRARRSAPDLKLVK